jgi:hypothetical protein
VDDCIEALEEDLEAEIDHLPEDEREVIEDYLEVF